MNARGANRLKLAAGLLRKEAAAEWPWDMLKHIEALSAADREALRAAVDWIEDYEAAERIYGVGQVA